MLSSFISGARCIVPVNFISSMTCLHVWVWGANSLWHFFIYA
jgi:hypothetical protein